MYNPQIFQQSYSKHYSSINGIPVVDKEKKETMDNIKLHILERDNNIINEYEFPIVNIFNDKKKLFQKQNRIAKNLVLQNTLNNFKNIRDSISLAKSIARKRKAPVRKKKAPTRKRNY